MSIALLPTRPTAPHLSLVEPTPVPAARALPIPSGAEARGFALYVGLDEASATAAGVDLAELVDRLKRVVAEAVPSAETHAAIAIAPAAAGGRDIDVVRAALHEPAFAKRHLRPTEEPAPRRRTGIVVDVSRKRVLIDGDAAPLTFKEFELLQFLVLREGRTVDRTEIVAGLWADATEEPGSRTIDVHVRRLRAKLGDYDDIIRTVRGTGYRFDRHADVSVRLATTPSPDLF